MIDTTDYLAEKEKEIFDAIWKLCKEGENKDSVKLKALCKLFDKIRPDKKQMDLQFGDKSPYEVLKEQLEKDAGGQG